MNPKLLFLIGLTMFFIGSCGGGEMKGKVEPAPLLKDIPVVTWEKLGEKRIYFGHQSVGFNIIDGLKDVMAANPQIRLKISETHNPEDFQNPLFAHSRVGENAEPKSKIDNFAEFMDAGIGNRGEIAFFKFCYVDAIARTNVESLFAEYRKTMARLKEKYPQTTFVHVTIPLTFVKEIWKTRIKKMIGKKDIWEFEDNMVRNRYNELLVKEYTGKEPVFDLAKLESTYPDGRRSVFRNSGRTYYSMVADYTEDGGHLNAIGRKFVAAQLLIFLANLSR